MRISRDFFRHAARSSLLWIAYALLYALLLSLPDLVIAWQDESFRPALKSFNLTASLSAVAPYLWRFPVGRGVLLFFLALAYVQLVYFQYFGIMFGPADVWLVYAEFKDVMLGLTDLPLGGVLASLALVVVAALVLYLKKFLPRSGRLLHLLCLPLCLYIIGKPVIGVWTDNPWRGAVYNPDARYAVLKNGFNATFWAVLKHIPAQAMASDTGKAAYADYAARDLAKTTLPSIVLVLGESLNPDRMSLFGHDRPTTPGLERLLKTYQGSYARVMASATMTRVSVPMFLNVVREPDNYKAHRQGEFNLFRLAKAHGYKTLFVSTQEMDGLSSLIGLKHIDHWRDARSKGDQHGVVADADLPAYLGNLLDGVEQPVFAVINPRVAHVPYVRYVPESERNFSRQEGLAGLELRRAEYDDAVSYFDRVVSESVETALKKIKGPVAVVVVSDHGERLGETPGKLGHGVVHPDVGKTPFMLFQRGDTFGQDAAVNACPRTHYDIGVLLGRLLGYGFDNPNDDGRRFLNGTDLNGVGGFLAYEPASIGYLQEKCRNFARQR